MPDPTPLRADLTLPWPDAPDPVVYHGLAGEIVRTLDPATEADPVGVLVSLLAGVGNAIGPDPYLILDHAPHGLRVWPILVGPTGTGRKGTALAAAGSVLSRAQGAWWNRQVSGLASGEGLIYHVRDEVRTKEPIRVKGSVTGYQEVIIDPGIDDKRLFVVETEFGSVLQQLAREKSTLSAVVRNAWDGKQLSSMVKNSPTRATGAHITITGHITPEEVRALLSSQDISNGFGNRFLWVSVRRSKLLPLGGEEDRDKLHSLATVLEETIDEARTFGEMRRDEEADEDYVRVYESLTGDGPGTVGQLISRAAPTVMRLAAIYAALDASSRIGRVHLTAALALWTYAESSVRHIFGVQPATAAPPNPYRRTILIALAGGPLTITEITNDLFDKNLRAPEPHATLSQLEIEGLIAQSFRRPESGKGRPAQLFTITEQGRQEVAS